MSTPVNIGKNLKLHSSATYTLFGIFVKCICPMCLCDWICISQLIGTFETLRRKKKNLARETELLMVGLELTS